MGNEQPKEERQTTFYTIMHSTLTDPKYGIYCMAQTPAGAWSRFTGFSPSDIDYPRTVEAWSQRGYRLFKMKVEHHDEP